MKKIILVIAVITVAVSSWGQGMVFFNNRIPGAVEAPVMRGFGLPKAGEGAGEGFTAELLLVTPGGSLAPLTPTTVFRSISAAVSPYVIPVEIAVPGLAPGCLATFRFVAYETAAGNYESARASGTFAFGQSYDVTINLGGGGLPASYLVGLNGFEVAVPEPCTIAVGVLGAVALVFRRWKYIVA